MSAPSLIPSESPITVQWRIHPLAKRCFEFAPGVDADAKPSERRKQRAARREFVQRFMMEHNLCGPYKARLFRGWLRIFEGRQSYCIKRPVVRPMASMIQWVRKQGLPVDQPSN